MRLSPWGSSPVGHKPMPPGRQECLPHSLPPGRKTAQAAGDAWLLARSGSRRRCRWDAATGRNKTRFGHIDKGIISKLRPRQVERARVAQRLIDRPAIDVELKLQIA